MSTSMRANVVDTIFDGHKFRSRLEARWAVFFKALGVKYEYEKETYSVPAGAFLPTFWLSVEDCFVQIGSTDESHTGQACAELAHLTRRDVLFVVGQPWPNEYNVEQFGPNHVIRNDDEEMPHFYDMQFAEDRRVPEILCIAGDSGYTSLTPSRDDDVCERWPLTDTDWMNTAYEAARQARFDGKDKWPWTK